MKAHVARCAASLVLLTAAATSQTQGTLFYTRFAGSPGDPFLVKSVGYSYDGSSSLTLSTPVGIAQLPAADGLTVASDGDLVVAGQSSSVFKIDPSTGNVACTANAMTPAFHVTLDPGGQKVWVGGIPGSLAEVPILPTCGTGTVRPLSGADTQITQLVFVGNDVYYTASGVFGNGSFGVLDMSTFTTTRLMSNVPAAHGIALDSFTGDLILFGAQQIWQIRPSTTNPTVVATADFSNVPNVGNNRFDQGTTDGNGNLFAAVNNGYLVFIDYARTGTVDINNASNYWQVTFLDSNLDDVAPLGGACSSAMWSNYGSGWPGTAGVPGLTLSAPPRLGSASRLQLQNTAGMATRTCIVFSMSSAVNSTPFGGTQLVGGTLVEIPAGLPMTGLTIPFSVPNFPFFCGLQLYAQAYAIDTGASRGISFSPGLTMRVGI